MQWPVVGVGVVLVSAHVASELALVSEDGPALPYFWPAALACGVVAFALHIPPSKTRPWWRDYATTGIEMLAVLIPLAWWGNVFVPFATAYLTVASLLCLLQFADMRGMVRYDTNAHGFIVTRSASYAAMRALTTFVVRQGWIPVRVGRLVAFLVASAETVAMLVLNSKSYSFTTRSWDIVPYALFKSAVFLALPLLEEALLQDA